MNFSPPVFVTPVNIIGFGSGNLFGNFRVSSFPNMDVNQTNGQIYIGIAWGHSNNLAYDLFLSLSPLS